MTENALPSDAAESRRLVQADAEDLSDLIPESVLRKEMSSGARLPPLRAGTCWSPRVIFPLGK